MSRRQNDRLRAMYVGGRGNATARRYARFWNMVMRLGLLPRRWVTLEVRGRRTGTVIRFPLRMADVGGQWYVVSMLGECNWVQNVRAAGGHATCRDARRVGSGSSDAGGGAGADDQAVRQEGARRPATHPRRPPRARRGIRDGCLELPGLPRRAALVAHPSQRPAPPSVLLDDGGTREVPTARHLGALISRW